MIRSCLHSSVAIRINAVRSVPSVRSTRSTSNSTAALRLQNRRCAAVPWDQEELPDDFDESDWHEVTIYNENAPWRYLLDFPEEFWDNRADKLSKKSPDFKHKTTGAALWLSAVPDLMFDEMKYIPDPPTNWCKEEAWHAVIDSPERYWDNRVNKVNPKSPDFKHKSTGDALWLNDAPEWVVEQLGSMPAPPSRPKLSGSAALWESLLSDPTQFYDNRRSKLNPKSPDFKHKSSGEALWLNSAPKSVLEKLT